MPVFKTKTNAGYTVNISGSLAFDRIMFFPGVFSEHILPGQVHNLNISFFLESLRQSDGGTAGNIAYNLALLGERPTILGVAGFDFLAYRDKLQVIGVDVSRVRIIKKLRTATAHIITDQKDNQIAAFFPGPLPTDYVKKTASFKKAELAIISPDDKGRMMEYANIYQKKGVPYIFDPGQAVIAFSGPELLKIIRRAKLLIGNDYEIKLISNKIGISFTELCREAGITVVTKGAEGSEIQANGKKILIKAVRINKVIDPTGAGDAYRAGFIKGLLLGHSLEACGRMGSVAAAFAVERQGTQNHKFTGLSFKKRYFAEYKDRLSI